jgi:hypothetical protein
MIHKQRYFASLKGPESERAPLCLQYSIWAAAASISEKYSQCEALLYERARKYVDADEMKVGFDFVLVSSTQADMDRTTARVLLLFSMRRHADLLPRTRLEKHSLRVLG